MLIGDWYKIISVNEAPVQHTFFIKKASRNIMAVLLHRLIENEDSNQNNEDSEDTKELDDAPQEFFVSGLNDFSFVPEFTNVLHAPVVFHESTRYHEIVSPPPKA